jgi:hypothetical protein
MILKKEDGSDWIIFRISVEKCKII